jgi:uncharacterized delta-60 repeat protein
MIQEILNFSVTNTTDGSIPVSLFGNNANPNDNANATTQYFWDVTGFTISFESTITIQYKTPTQLSFTNANLTFSGTSIQDVVNALNTLSLGVFFITTSGGNTYINNYNTTYVFGQLLVFNPSILDLSLIIGSGFNAQTRPIVVQSDGKILIGGFYTTFNGNVNIRLVRLNSDGSIDNTFNTGSGFFGGSGVVCISLQTDGKILVGGDFNSYDGNSTNNIVRLNSNGSIDLTFNIGTGFNNVVDDIAIQTDGKILVSGNYTSYNGTGANRIVRLNTNGSVDGSFVYGTGFDNDAYCLRIQPDGNILVGGLFTTYNGTGANGIVRLTPTGAIDGTFVYGTGINGTTLFIGLQSDGRIIPCGTYTDYNGTPANNIIRINTNGSVDGTFVYGTGFNNNTTTAIIQANGQIYVTGNYTSYNGTSANRIIKLNSNGSIDTSWNYGSGFNALTSFSTFQSDGKILVAGNFTTAIGESYNRLARLFPI